MRISDWSSDVCSSDLEPVTGRAGPVRLHALPLWQQGRTLYGGASALIAYTMATRTFTGLPPLRAAQIGFVAPLGRSEERRVGRECGSKCRSRWSQYH